MNSEVLRSDFPGLRTFANSMTSTASTTSVASMTSTASFHQKSYTFRPALNTRGGGGQKLGAIFPLGPRALFRKENTSRKQGLAELNQIFAGSIDGVDNMLVKNFDCCFLRQILTTVMLKIKKYGLRVLIWAEVQPLIDVLALP